MSDVYDHSNKETSSRTLRTSFRDGVSQVPLQVPLARHQKEVVADEPSALGIRGDEMTDATDGHSSFINTTGESGMIKNRKNKAAPSKALAISASPPIATSSRRLSRGSGIKPIRPTVKSIAGPAVSSSNANYILTQSVPGAVRVRGFQIPNDDNASVVSEFDTSVVATKSEHTEPNLVEVEVVTDAEIRNRIQNELLQDVVVANNVMQVKQREKDGEVGQSTNRSQRKLAVVVVAILLVAAMVVVTPLVVTWNARRGNGSGPHFTPPLSPTASRFAAFRSILLNQSLSSADALLDTNSPQYRALDWLATKDPARLPESTAYDVIKERFVIATLYFATNGTNWNSNFGFLSGESICQWNDQTNKGVTCGPNNLTQDLNLQGNGLAGTIPTELGELFSLTNLNFAVNRLIGTVPTDLQKLSSLVVLRFNKNQLSGKVPTELYRLSSLTRFWHGFNAFSGSIPTEIGMVSSLVDWRLGTNRFTGRIPTELGRLSNLAYLDLSNNALTGTVPTSLRTLSRLDALYLTNTNLTGNLTSIFCIGSQSGSDPDPFESDYCTQEIVCNCCTNFCS